MKASYANISKQLFFYTNWHRQFLAQLQFWGNLWAYAFSPLSCYMQRILQLLLVPGRCLSQTEILCCSSQGGFRRQLSVSHSALNFCVCDSECRERNAKSYFFPQILWWSQIHVAFRDLWEQLRTLWAAAPGSSSFLRILGKSGPGSEAAAMPLHLSDWDPVLKRPVLSIASSE